MIDLSQIEARSLETDPFEWLFLSSLFQQADAHDLAETFPRDHFKTVKGYDGEKGYEYEARALIHMGASVPFQGQGLSSPWRELAGDLIGPNYRAAISRLTGRDFSTNPIEANVFHYGPGAWLGPHVDLPDKLLTQIFYFNHSWVEADGGNLTILRSGDITDAVNTVLPIVGNSVVVVRSEKSWHAVTPVTAGCRNSRRSLAVTFYRPGSISTMWPPGDQTPLHDYFEGSKIKDRTGGLWQRLKSRLP